MTELTKIKKEISKLSKNFSAVLPNNINVDKFMATLWLEVQKNPKLAECENLLQVAKDVATFGLILGEATQQAYILPFSKNVKEGNVWIKKPVAKLIIGYKGYIAKLEEAGYSIETELVTKRELEEGRFIERRGSVTEIVHEPIREGIRSKDEIVLAYCILKKKDRASIISVLSREEIEEMSKTDSYNQSTKRMEKELGKVWTQNQRLTDFGQMCIKAVIRNVVKKANLMTTNEMSYYEGKRDEEFLKDVIPSKTQNLESFQFENGESLQKEEFKQNDKQQSNLNN